MSSAQDRTASGATPAAGGPGAHRETASYPEPGYGARAYYGNGTGVTGSTILAATLMILDGLWNFFVGLAAIIRQSFFVSHANYEFHWNVHAWGWLHFALGIVLFAAGACVLLGQTWAKLVGIVLAVFSGLATFLFLPYYPVWSIVVLAIDVFIIWALSTSIARSDRAA